MCSFLDKSIGFDDKKKVAKEEHISALTERLQNDGTCLTWKQMKESATILIPRRLSYRSIIY